MSHESAARWRRRRDGNLRVNRPHPVKYPPEVVRAALGLAYGGHGLKLDEVAVMMGVSAPTISIWKKRHLGSGTMDIPEIDPKDIERLSPEDRSKMTGDKLEAHIRKFELKAAVPEGTVKVLKAGGIGDLVNDEKAAIIDTLPRKFSVVEALEVVGASPGSYYHCRSKAGRPNGHEAARAAISEEFALVRGRPATATSGSACARGRIR